MDIRHHPKEGYTITLYETDVGGDILALLGGSELEARLTSPFLGSGSIPFTLRMDTTISDKGVDFSFLPHKAKNWSEYKKARMFVRNEIARYLRDHGKYTTMHYTHGPITFIRHSDAY